MSVDVRRQGWVWGGMDAGVCEEAEILVAVRTLGMQLGLRRQGCWLE